MRARLPRLADDRTSEDVTLSVLYFSICQLRSRLRNPKSLPFKIALRSCSGHRRRHD